MRQITRPEQIKGDLVVVTLLDVAREAGRRMPRNVSARSGFVDVSWVRNAEVYCVPRTGSLPRYRVMHDYPGGCWFRMVVEPSDWTPEQRIVPPNKRDMGPYCMPLPWDRVVRLQTPSNRILLRREVGTLANVRSGSDTDGRIFVGDRSETTDVLTALLPRIGVSGQDMPVVLQAVQAMADQAYPYMRQWCGVV
jgi:hypothetical protein